MDMMWTWKDRGGYGKHVSQFRFQCLFLYAVLNGSGELCEVCLRGHMSKSAMRR